MPLQTSPNITRLSFGLLLLLYLLFILAASFYLTGKAPSTESAIQTLLEKGSAFSFNFHNLRDVATNILLYMPLGFLCSLYIASKSSPRLMSPYLFVGFLVSTLVEITQAFIGRYSDISDVISNTSGFITSYFVAYIALKHFHFSPSSLLGIEQKSDNAALQNISGIRFIYIAVAYITCLLPLNITVSLSDIYAKLNSQNSDMPRLILDPFFHFSSASVDWQYLTLNCIIFIPLAFLSAHIQIKRQTPNILVPAVHCLFFSLCIEVSEVFIKSGRSDIFMPYMASMIGLSISLLCIKLYQEPSAHVNSKDKQKYDVLLSIVLYSLFLFSVALSPFDFELSLKAIKQKLIYDSNVIPFKAHFSARSIGAAVDIVREVLLYLPLGSLLSL
ncbi:VanZ family protein, partial [Oleiphilus sp. HI0132]